MLKNDKLSLNYLLNNNRFKCLNLEEKFILMNIYNNQSRNYWGLDYFSKRLNRTRQTISKYMENLHKCGFINRIKLPEKRYYQVEISKYMLECCGVVDSEEIVNLFNQVYHKER